MTINPSSDPDLYRLLLHVGGIDSVDDERHGALARAHREGVVTCKCPRTRRVVTAAVAQSVGRAAR